MKVLAQIMVVSILLCGTLFISSCTDDISSDKSGPSFSSVVEKTNTEIKKEFGAALAKVLAESTPVRELIKKEALKKIDYDYDVLYLLIKDDVLSDSTTLEGLLLEYLDCNFLKLIENKIPNLTIFVPELPNNSFSAELWDVEADIPDVGIRTFDQDGVPAYSAQKGEYIINSFEVPEYPIVVIKENERIIAENMATKSLGVHGESLKKRSSSNLTLAFIDDEFNNLKEKNVSSTLRIGRGDDKVPHNYEKAKEAYNIYKNIDGWHRDYVYYNLKPEAGIPRDSIKGPFIYETKECIVGFELLGDPEEVLAQISDQGRDPKIDSYSGRRPYISWTEGEFEFLVKINLGSISLVGSDLNTYFRAKGDDLFQGGPGSGHGPIKLGLKKMDLKLPLFEWNLENYTPTVKIAIEEVDNTETIKNTQTTTVEFAGNIGYDISSGTTVKKGLKFGASAKKSHTIGYEISTTIGNDELGEVVVNFGDPIFVESSYVDRQGNTIVESVLNPKYYTGYYRLYIAPEAM